MCIQPANTISQALCGGYCTADICESYAIVYHRIIVAINGS